MGRDCIRLSGIVIYGSHGVIEAERAIERPFQVDVELRADLSAAGAADDLKATVDYAAVCALVRRANEAGPYHLLEAFAERIAKNLLGELHISEVTVKVRKPHPPVGMFVEAAEVEITRAAGERAE